MRLMRCTLPEGATITVQGRETGRTFRGGDAVDVDAVAVPADGDRPAQTWGDVLGHHVEDHFEIAAELDPSKKSKVRPGQTTGPVGSDVRPIDTATQE